nr:MAG TPA: hypothetical protein [Caudoviricetes sp.]
MCINIKLLNYLGIKQTIIHKLPAMHLTKRRPPKNIKVLIYESSLSKVICSFFKKCTAFRKILLGRTIKESERQKNTRISSIITVSITVVVNITYVSSIIRSRSRKPPRG